MTDQEQEDKLKPLHSHRWEGQDVSRELPWQPVFVSEDPVELQLGFIHQETNMEDTRSLGIRSGFLQPIIYIYTYLEKW